MPEEISKQFAEINAEVERHRAQLDRQRIILEKCRQLQGNVNTAIARATEAETNADERLAKLNALAAALACYIKQEDSIP
jgi:hypothetical protein